MSSVASHLQEPDPRSKAAALRRERMRQRLIEAVLELYQPGQAAQHVLIDDVIKLADVSRGSFYKYFESIDAVVEELAEAMTVGMIADYRRLFEDISDPLVRAVGGAMMVMLRALHDPRWGGFTCRIDFVDYFARERAFDLMVRDALEGARDGGQIMFTSADAAVDLIVGMTVEARRRLVRGISDPHDYMDEMIRCTFCGLAAAPDVVALACEQVRFRIFQEATELDWWSSSIAHG
ncbi:TetR/AcrR family transcriptional regulator [Novosphingobium aerophilum]|uniref:TetR/AcrR family transcriptional regulator n=1 Tax=Novosphingobium pentaromativorans TaxID=205844 RepID=A0A2W5NMC7_9SPHN|nr:TetR/AcrR family transcriptional regulator [Novosphingobium sp. TCA1]PZQ53648.1 MAG: TetR/AcrR family transcriptional regulator [Novosphingobium pentaromativorans]GFE75707.1 hypothetical protein NTCA1_33560 [Novosphingobium sp. TCA1]